MFGGDGGVVGHVPALVLAPVLPPDLLNDDLSAQHESLSIWHQTVLHYRVQIDTLGLSSLQALCVCCTNFFCCQ